MKRLPLTQGKFTLLDATDFEWASQWKWRYSFSKWGGYAVREARTIKNNRNSRTSIYLHRALLNCPLGFEVDHRNHLTLDNRRSNLRLCTSSQNKHNMQIGRANKSGYKGVSRTKQGKPWMASIRHDGKTVYLGTYEGILQAAEAYNQAAVRFFGEFAQLNSLA